MSETDKITIDVNYAYNKLLKNIYLLLGGAAIAGIITFIIVHIEPNRYIAEGVLKIGKIGGIPIEKYNNIKAQSFTFLGMNEIYSFPITDQRLKNIKLEVSERNDLIHFYIEGINKEKINSHMLRLIKYHLEKHKKIYTEGRNIIEKNISNAWSKILISPHYFIKSSNYPTRVISDPASILRVKPNFLWLKVTLVSLLTFFFLSFIILAKKDDKKRN